jgi:hypothetical protein
MQKKASLRIVACGGRDQTFDMFTIAVASSGPSDTCALLVDSECAITARDDISHLRQSDGWTFPALGRHRVFLMVQMMEAWFLADRDALTEFYDGGFLAKSLPGTPTNVESVRKEDLEASLKNATRNTRTKGEYRKLEHGAALLSRINPQKVEAGSSHAREFHGFLRSL